jgi:LCP family protein required for cell wall assembly
VLALVLVPLTIVGAQGAWVWWHFRQIRTVAIPDDPGVSSGGQNAEAAASTAPDTPVTDTTAEIGDDGTGDTGYVPPPFGIDGLPLPSVPAGTDGGPTDFDPTVYDLEVAPGSLVASDPRMAVGGPNTRNYLMVGTDDRSTLPDSDGEKFGKGQVTGSRTDTIMLLRVDPDADRAWVLSFPRDLWVRIAGTDRFDRINSAFSRGEGVLVQTIRENFNLPVDHLVIVDFVGFQKIVGALGGVPICFAKPTRDTVTGLNQPPGCNVLDESQAIAFVRSRRLQVGENGEWKTDPSSDRGRIRRQQTFIRAVMSRALKGGFASPARVNAAIPRLKDAIVIDKGLDLGEVLALARDLRSFDPAELEAFTVPTVDARIDGKAVQTVNDEAAKSIIGRFGSRTK